MKRYEYELLELFRDLKIGKEELLDKLNVYSLNELKDVVMISNVHVIKLLENFKAGNINKKELLEWVNTIWFSDSYDCIDEEMDSIANVMNKLEEIDEARELDNSKLDSYIESLKVNR